VTGCMRLVCFDSWHHGFYSWSDVVRVSAVLTRPLLASVFPVFPLTLYTQPRLSIMAARSTHSGLRSWFPSQAYNSDHGIYNHSKR
jgi:hypothetical protein